MRPAITFLNIQLSNSRYLFPHRLADALLSGKRLRDRNGANSQFYCYVCQLYCFRHMHTPQKLFCFF